MMAKQDEFGRLEAENRRLKSAVEELSIINDISTAINSTLSLDKIIELIVQKCIKHLKVEQGTVTLLESGGSENQFRTIMRKADQTTGYMPLHLDTQITGWMLVNKKPLVIDDLESDERFRTFESDGPLFRTLLSVPLILKGRIIGSINVFNKRGGEQFSEADKRLLSIIATQSAQVIETRTYLADPPDCRYATQSGPMLVIDGKLHPRFLPDSDSRHIRNGVGVDAGGIVHFAISDQPVTFHEFGRFFRDALGTPNALYLDGKVSKLHAPELHRSDGGLPMGPIVGVVVAAPR